MDVFNYECEGQISIFDLLGESESMTQKKAGEWVDNHGNRVMFEDIQVNHYYIADYSTCSRKCYKVIYVMWKNEDSVGYVDDERGIKRGWSWGNSYSALTRQMYVDSDPNKGAGMADTSGWWYEMEG
jgi:hypothetical protein